jgi:Tfp pilus assembly protein PilO
MSRDRILVSVLVVAALVGGFWFAVLGPKRDAVRSLDAQLNTQRQRLERAQASVAQAHAARARYDADYSAVVMLGKAVPEQKGMPSLLYQIDSSARNAKIDFSSVTADAAAAPSAAGTGAPATGAQAPGGSSTSATSSGSAASIAAVAPTAMPVSFIFSGSFFGMEHMLDVLHGFVRPHGDDLAVRGRLVSIDDIALTPSSQGFPKVQATISASAYTMPAATTPDGAAQPSAGTPSSATSTPTTATGNTP